MPIGAVITADIANFTQLTPGNQKRLISQISSLAKSHKIEFYRGDSFQIYLKHPQEALKLILKLRTATKAVAHHSSKPVADIRAGIGIGEVDTPVRTLRTATGEAFVLSGRGFDSTVNSKQRLIIQSKIPSFNETLKVIALFVDYLVDRMTTKQAEVIFELLNNLTQQEVARKLYKSQPTINQHIQSAGWTEIVNLMGGYEAITAQIK
jgi:hypothetical protein